MTLRESCGRLLAALALSAYQAGAWAQSYSPATQMPGYAEPKPTMVPRGFGQQIGQAPGVAPLPPDGFTCQARHLLDQAVQQSMQRHIDDLQKEVDFLHSNWAPKKP